jgi:putative hydrolase of the HAD superfamily
VDPFRDAAEAIPQLAARLPLGIISNANTHLSQIGLAEHFQVMVSPSRAGCSKPDAGIFHYAARALGCEPAGVLHVGDSWADDVLGAVGAGCRSAWYNRLSAKMPAGATPDRVLTDLRELVSWVNEG